MFQTKTTSGLSLTVFTNKRIERGIKIQNKMYIERYTESYFTDFQYIKAKQTQNTGTINTININIIQN